MIELRAASATDVGLVRSINQDQYLVADPLFAVADGMGGAKAGDVASATAIETLAEAFAEADRPTPNVLVKAAEAANRAVWERGEANPDMQGMGTTLVALTKIEGDRVAVVNVGDSRLYAFRAGELRQITEDHNLVYELMQEGRLTPEEAEVHPRRNILTRALGADPEVPVDLFIVDAEAGDRYLLCSDGLPREVKDDQIAALLRRLKDPADAAQELVNEAKRRGGNDNITVVLVDVVDTELEKGEADGATEVLPAAPAVRPQAGPDGPVSKPPRTGGPAHAASRQKTRLITLRVVAFFVGLLLILGGAAAGLTWYARSGYFVSLRGQEIVVFKGQPGGVLWFQPTMAQPTGDTTSDVLPFEVPKLQSGVSESSVAAADEYILSLLAANAAAIAAGSPTSSSTTTTTPTGTSTGPSTTAPRTTTTTRHTTATTAKPAGTS